MALACLLSLEPPRSAPMQTVLFVHGLESGPRGKKSLALEQAGFRVVAGQMPCGQRAVVRDPAVIAVLVATLASAVAAAYWGGVLGLIVAVVAVALLQRPARAWLMRRVFQRSVAVQLRLLATSAIDVVVASSFGGAVAVELLARGAWKGPTLLLCPAHRLVASRAWAASPALPGEASNVVVVHGTRDQTVPLDDSRALVDGTRAQLIEVDDDHRLSAQATPASFERWIDLASAPS